MIWRFLVSDGGRTPLPPIDVDATGTIVIGSGAGAQVRVPSAVAREGHVEIVGGRWIARADVHVDGRACASGERGELAVDGVTAFAIGSFRVEVSAAPEGATPTGPMRTASLARELVRGLLGDGGVPTLVIERGPLAGTTRPLAPPLSTLVIGRGDDAGWVIVDEDLSRAHAEIRREWDGTRVVDRGSKNGTRVDGVAVGEGGTGLVDGALVELGSVALRFNDPAERHLRGELPVPQAVMRLRIPSIPPGGARVPRPPDADAGRSTTFWVALAVAGAALGALAWLLLG